MFASTLQWQQKPHGKIFVIWPLKSLPTLAVEYTLSVPFQEATSIAACSSSTAIARFVTSPMDVSLVASQQQGG